MKRVISLILFSVILSLLLIFLKGKENANISQSCYSKNNVIVKANEDITFAQNHLDSLKQIINDNNWVFVSQVINPEKLSYNFINYNESMKQNSGFLECVNYFKNYRNDSLNWSSNYIFIKEELDFNSIRLFNFFADDITSDLVKAEFTKHNLTNKFDIQENSDEFINQTDNTFYDLLYTTLIIFSLTYLFTDFYNLYKQEKEYRLLKSFGYSDILILKQLVIKKRVMEMIIVFITSVIILFIYYQSFNQTFILLLFVIAGSFIVVVFMSIGLLKLFDFLLEKNKYLFFNVFLIFIFLVASLFSIARINETVLVIDLKKTISNTRVKEKYYNNFLALNTTSKQKKDISIQLINKYNAFDVGTFGLDEKINKMSASSKYLENITLFDNNGDRIKYQSNDKCQLLVTKEYLKNKEVINSECKIILLKDKQTYLTNNGYPEYSNDPVMIEVSNKDIIYDSLIFQAKDEREASEILKYLYKQNGVSAEIDLKSANGMLNASIENIDVYIKQSTLLILVNMIALFNLNIVLSYILFKSNYKSIFVKYSYGYSVFQVMSIIFKIYAFIYLFILIYSFIVFGIISIPIVLSLALLSYLIINFRIYKKLNNEFVNFIKGDV